MVHHVYKQDIDALLVEYEDLIDKVATLNPIFSPYYEKEDLKQDLRMILVRCNNQFDPNMGANFKSYFVTSCKYYIWDERRRHKADLSLDSEIELHGQQRLTYKDTLVDKDILQDDDFYDHLELLKTIPNSDITIDYMFNGKTLTEMAKERGVSHQAVQQMNQLVLQKLRDILANS